MHLVGVAAVVSVCARSNSSLHIHSHKSAHAAFFYNLVHDAFPVNYSERVLSIKRCRLQLISDKTRPVALSQSRHIERLVLPRRDDLDKHLLVHTIMPMHGLHKWRHFCT